MKFDHQHMMNMLGAYHRLQAEVEAAMNINQGLVMDTVNANETINVAASHISALTALLTNAQRCYQDLQAAFTTVTTSYESLKKQSSVFDQSDDFYEG